MTDPRPFYVMTEQQAAHFRELTAGDGDRLDPRVIDAGPYAGQYVLPKRVRSAEEFRACWDAFDALTVVDLDPEEAWPPRDHEMVADQVDAEG